MMETELYTVEVVEVWRRRVIVSAEGELEAGYEAARRIDDPYLESRKVSVRLATPEELDT